VKAEPAGPQKKKLDVGDYGQYRGRILDGDILCFSGQHWLSSLIRWATHGRYSHAGLAFWWGERLMVLQAEAGPGVQALPASRAIGEYRGKVDWYPLAPERRTPEFLADITKIAMERLGDSYSIWHLVAAGFHQAWKTPLPRETQHPRTFICAQYVAYCYQQAHCGLLPGHTNLATTPEDIAKSTVHGAAVRLKG
jgi:hypothetical protein